MKLPLSTIAFSVLALGVPAACNFGADTFKIVSAQDGGTEPLGGSGPGGANGNTGGAGSGGAAGCQETLILADDFDDAYELDVGVKGQPWANAYEAETPDCTWKEGAVVPTLADPPSLEGSACGIKSNLASPVKLDNFMLRVAIKALPMGTTFGDAGVYVELLGDDIPTMTLDVTENNARVLTNFANAGDLATAPGSVGPIKYVELVVKEGQGNLLVSADKYASEGGTVQFSGEGIFTRATLHGAGDFVRAQVLIREYLGEDAMGGNTVRPLVELLDLQIINGCP